MENPDRLSRRRRYNRLLFCSVSLEVRHAIMDCGNSQHRDLAWRDDEGSRLARSLSSPVSVRTMLLLPTRSR